MCRGACFTLDMTASATWRCRRCMAIMLRGPLPRPQYAWTYREGIWRSDVAQSLLAVPCTVSTAVQPGLTLCGTPNTESWAPGEGEERRGAQPLMSWLVSIKVHYMRISTSSYPKVLDAWRLGTYVGVVLLDVPSR